MVSGAKDQSNSTSLNPPSHIAIIMDGNGRWAKDRAYGRTRGHREGARRVDEIVTACCDLGVSYLTLYAFSTENWNRPASEVSLLMRLLVQHLRTMDKKLKKNRVQLVAQGTLDRLPPFVRRELDRVIKVTSNYEPRMRLTLCLSYGGRQEIVDATKAIAKKVQSGEIKIDEITENTLGDHLYQPDLPDPDLLIRTGGEYRISNFLIWEVAYSEMYVTNTLWPDFRREDLEEAISVFHGRERRFGKISEQLVNPPTFSEATL